MAARGNALRARRASATLAALALLATVWACRPPGAKTEAIRFWALGREGEVVRELIPEFERRYPGLRVEVQQIPFTAAHEKLLTAVIGRNTPDLAQVGNTWVPEFVALSALEPLDEEIAASKAVRPAAFFPGIWETNEVDGRIWGVPWYVDTRVLFYRPDLLRAAGLPGPPKTWAEWRAALAGLKAIGAIGSYAILFPTDEWAQPVILGFQAGAAILRDGGQRGAFRAPEFRRAAEFYVSLFQEGYAPPLSNAQVSNVYQQFDSGDFGMWVTGPWDMGQFRARLAPSREPFWATAPLPSPDDPSTPGVSLAGGSSLVLFRGSARRKAAWKLLEFLSEPEQQARFYELSGDLPSVIETWERPALSRDPKASAFAVQLRHVRPAPKVPEWEAIMQRVAERFQEVLHGQKPLDAMLEALDQDVDRLLEKRRWLLAGRKDDAR
jgi:multiple sugar transport system substrate-binding protein